MSFRANIFFQEIVLSICRPPNQMRALIRAGTLIRLLLWVMKSHLQWLHPAKFDHGNPGGAQTGDDGTSLRSALGLGHLTWWTFLLWTCPSWPAGCTRRWSLGVSTLLSLGASPFVSLNYEVPGISSKPRCQSSAARNPLGFLNKREVPLQCCGLLQEHRDPGALSSGSVTCVCRCLESRLFSCGQAGG